MTSIEAPMSVDQNVEDKVFDLCRMMLYLQGFWQDDTEPGLELYLKYFSPRFANLLVKHRFLRLALRLFRRFNPWWIIVTLSIQVFVQFPTSIYLHRTNIGECIVLFFGIIFSGLVLAMASTAIFQPETIKTLFALLDEMLGPDKLDNKEQREIYLKTRIFCKKIVKNYQIPITVLMNTVLTLDVCFHLLPERRFAYREWFPWDTMSSPAFEITLFCRWFQAFCLHMQGPTMVLAIFISATLIRTNFQVLNNKLENIRPISIKKIKARKLKKSVRLAEDAIVTIEFEHSQRFYMPGPALRGGHLIPGQATLSESRVDSLGLVSTLYEAGDAGSSCGRRDEIPLQCVLRGDQLRTGSAALSDNRVDNLTLLRPLYEGVDSGSSCGRDQSPIDVVLQVGQLTAGPAPLNVRRVNESASLRPLYGAGDCGTSSGSDQMPKEVDYQDCDDTAVNELEEVTATELDQEMQDALSEDIHLHVKLIRCLGLGEKLGNVTAMVTLLANTLLLGITALSVSKYDPSNANVGQVVPLWVNTVEISLAYLIVNNLMELVSDQHAAVCVSMYNSDWIDASPSFKKTMLVIMSRANVPLVMKPTGMDPLSRRNFAQVMNIAYKMVNTLSKIVK